MQFPRLKTIAKVMIIVPTAILLVVYVAALVAVALDDAAPRRVIQAPEPLPSIAIFGASGTAGDGILKAAIADNTIETIYVVTRRITSRMTAGMTLGKVVVIEHMDYMDYTAIIDQVAAANAVYWAIGLSAWGVDEETYRKIHVDFPVEFVKTWLGAGDHSGRTFHYISSSDISPDAKSMWAREKIRAENALFALAQPKKLKVIAYRPDYIGPTAEEAHLGQDVLYWFFAPVQASVRALAIGKAMLEVSADHKQFNNGDKLNTRAILRLADAYDRRSTTANIAPP